MTTILATFLRALFGKDDRVFTFLAWVIVLFAGLILTITLIVLILSK